MFPVKKSGLPTLYIKSPALVKDTATTKYVGPVNQYDNTKAQRKLKSLQIETKQWP